MWKETVATPMPINDMTVAEVLERWPETVSVFQDLKTACVGCAMAPFDTMADVAQIYDMELVELMTALERVGVQGEQDPPPQMPGDDKSE
jgi:hybrid cluster-associated redox disulfide protein